MIVLFLVLIILAAAVVWAYLTNPFNKFTVVKLPFVVEELAAGKFTDNLPRLKLRRGILWRWFAIFKCGVHILNTRYIRSPRSLGKASKEVIADVRRLRFDPSKLLLISGDHFSGLFVRNLGVFYYPTLDPRINDSDEDWDKRQKVYLQTVAYAIGGFAKHPVPTTTLIETGSFSATPVNFYAYPSDTVYAMLYALSALLGKEQAAPANYSKAHHQLQTAKIAGYLLQTYNQTLQDLYKNYRSTAYDDKTGLVRTDLHMSGAKDITRRRSSFFDNVVFWKTSQLAMDLGLIKQDQKFLADLKKRIIKTFWLEDLGYFLEDLSDEGKKGKYYSSDWLIVLATGFLKPANKTERHYFEKSVEYAREYGLCDPLPIRYQAETRAKRQFLAVRFAVASYGGDAIWSFWGMEYIKVLMLLYQQTGRADYKQEAWKHIKNYRRAIVKHGGYPEVYNADGELLQTPLYRSIRMTGWVIGFEQVEAMAKELVH